MGLKKGECGASGRGCVEARGGWLVSGCRRIGRALRASGLSRVVEVRIAGLRLDL